MNLTARIVRLVAIGVLVAGLAACDDPTAADPTVPPSPTPASAPPLSEVNGADQAADEARRMCQAQNGPNSAFGGWAYQDGERVPVCAIP